MASGQRIDWQSTSFNFGTVRDWDSPPAVFRLTNTGTSKLMFLPQHFGRDVQVVLPNRSIGPGETAEVTIHYYTADNGPFSKEVELFSNASDRPQRLTLRGNIVSLRNNALTACPTFSADQPAQSSGTSTITVVDRSTGQQVVGATVGLFKKEESRATYTTDSRGLVRTRLEMGRFTAKVEHPDYRPTVEEIALERRQGTVIIMVEPRKKGGMQPPAQQPERPAQAVTVHRVPAEAPVADMGVSVNEQMEEPVAEDRWAGPVRPVPQPPKKVEEPETDLGINVNDQFDEPPAAPVAPVSVGEQTPPATAVQAPAPEFAEATYRPNNIVLLLDVSSSMNKDAKLDRLKAAAARLIGMMRPIDRLSVLAFNAAVFTVLPPTSVTAPETIIDLIFDLQAEGYTSGVKGMKEAYAQLTAQWVEGGNNQLILVTDGMFNSSSFTEKDAILMAADHAGKGIILSVAGYAGDDDAERMMKRIARRGKGSYLRLDAQDGAIDMLANEIKERSRRPLPGQ